MTHFTPVDKSNPLWPTHLTNNRDLLFNEPFKPIHEDETKIISGGGGAWTPVDDPNAKTLWLDLKDTSTVSTSGTSITNVADKSGNGYDASPSGTVTYDDIEGKAVINSGSTDYLMSSHPSVSLTDWTYFILFQPTAESTWGRYMSWVVGTDYTTQNRTFLYRNSSSTTVNIGTKDGAGGTIGIIDGTAAVVTEPYMLMCQGSGDNIEGFRDAVSLGTTTFNSFTFENPATILGSGDAGTGMDLYEFIIVEGVLDQATREKYEGYLAWRHGLESNLPIGHPYKSVAPGLGGQTVTYEFNDHSPKLFKDCLYSYGTGLALSDGTNWRYGVHAKLDIVDPLDTGTATLDDIKTAYNDLLADMRAKGWLSV